MEVFLSVPYFAVYAIFGRKVRIIDGVVCQLTEEARQLL